MNPRHLALKIHHPGRFGNAVLRCCNAVLIARNQRIPTVIWPTSNLLSPFAGAHDPQLLADADNPHPAERVLLDKRGKSFLHDAAFALDGSILFCDWRIRRIRTPAAVAAVFASHIRPSLRPQSLVPVAGVGPEDLVLHFRAGDVFSHQDGSHPNYGQPALAFYRFALAGHLAAHPTATAHLVFEDRGNPVINAFEQHCRSSGVPVVAHSSKDLVDDLAVLLSARHLVLAIGTFGPVVAMLCPRRPDTVWIPRNNVPFLTETLMHLGTRIMKVDVRDPAAYIAPRGWKNTPAQRQLMLDFPLSGYALDATFPARRWWLPRWLDRTRYGPWRAVRI